jgi:hypothetical protein
LGYSQVFLFALKYLEWRNGELGNANPKEALEAFLAKRPMLAC